MSTKISFPLQKVTAEHRTVVGIITSESPDRAGEILDYATSREYFERWSASIHKATGGKSLGSVREMHAESAVGKLTSVVFNDELKQIEVEAKVVDDDAWQKCLEGVYSAFSIGGHYVRKWRDAATTLVRYTCEPREVSLVDFPALPGATFEIRKADGAVEIRKFAAANPSPASAGRAAEQRRAELRKQADEEVAVLAAPVNRLFKEVISALDRIIKASPGYRERVARCGTLDDQPLPAKAATRAVVQDSAAAVAVEVERVATLSDEERAYELMKDALRQPINLRKTIKDKD